MSAADRFGLRLLPANAQGPAHSRSHKAKNPVNPRAIRLHRFGPQSRVNSCSILSRVETIVTRSHYRSARAISRRNKYHYSGINTERRNSENSCTNCGNLAPSISTHFRMSLINKHLDLFQNGPPLANHVPPARVRKYWCPES